MAEASSYMEVVSDNGRVYKVNSKWTEIYEIAQKTILPKLPYPADGSCDGQLATFFTRRRLRSEKNLQRIIDILKSMEKGKVAMRKHVKPLFVMLGEQADGQEPWCCTENENKVSQIIAELYRILDMSMVPPGPLSAFFLADFHHFADPTLTTFGHVLKTFRATLGCKDPDLSRYPAAKRSFLWLVMQVKQPYLNEHLQDIIIPSLNMLDDHEIINNALGLCCLSHTFSNVQKSVACSTGYGRIVFDHYKKYLNINQPKLIDEVMPEICRILKMIEVDPHANCINVTLYDTVLDNLLSILETPDRDGLDKVIWLRHLANYMNIMGFAILHRFKRIVRVLLENANCVEPRRWFWILKCTQVLIANTWIRPKSHDLAEIILRIVYNISCLYLLISPEFNGIVKESEKLILDCFQSLSYYKDFPKVRKEMLEIVSCREEDNPFLMDFTDAARLIFRPKKGKPPKKK